MWPRTDLLELLGIAHPVVQAPMSGFTPPALAAAVCNAGWAQSVAPRCRGSRLVATAAASAIVPEPAWLAQWRRCRKSSTRCEFR